MTQPLLQSVLFEMPAPAVSGLTFMNDYIDTTSEAELIQAIDAQPWRNDLKRRVQHYGYAYDYRARSITPASRLGPLPPWLEAYCARLHQAGIFAEMPDQVIINEYQPGQGIAPHTDCVPCFGATIASLSLGSPCMMDFTNGKTGEKLLHLLEPRSLLILTGDARYVWQHAIAPRKTDRHYGQTIQRARRISLTFRMVMHSGEVTI